MFLTTRETTRLRGPLGPIGIKGPTGSQGINPIGPTGFTGEMGSPGPTCHCYLGYKDFMDVDVTGATGGDGLFYIGASGDFKNATISVSFSNIDFSNIPEYTSGETACQLLGVYKLWKKPNEDIVRRNMGGLVDDFEDDVLDVNYDLTVIDLVGSGNEITFDTTTVQGKLTIISTGFNGSNIARANLLRDDISLQPGFTLSVEFSDLIYNGSFPNFNLMISDITTNTPRKNILQVGYDPASGNTFFQYFNNGGGFVNIGTISIGVPTKLYITRDSNDTYSGYAKNSGGTISLITSYTILGGNPLLGNAIGVGSQPRASRVSFDNLIICNQRV